jgi:hypothetical protein
LRRLERRVEAKTGFAAGVGDASSGSGAGAGTGTGTGPASPGIVSYTDHSELVHRNLETGVSMMLQMEKGLGLTKI